MRTAPVAGVAPLLLALALVLGGAGRCVALSCTQRDGGDGPGTVYPRHDINVTPGTPFNITCQIDPSNTNVAGYDATHIYFTRKEVLASGDREPEVPADQYTVLNSTTVLLTDRLDTPAKYIYSCRLRKRDIQTMGICMSNVYVGGPPKRVENFTCVSYNWVGLNCSWDEPFNAVKTDYQLEYQTDSAVYKKPCVNESPPPEASDRRPGQTIRTGCQVDHAEFRYTHKRFRMVMNASNALGNMTAQNFGLFRTYAIVLPAAPEVVNVSRVEARQVELRVQVGDPMSSFPETLDFDVDYTSTWDPRPKPVNATTMAFIPMSSIQSPPWRNETSLVVGGLVPYTDYTFRVRVKSHLARGEEMWSQPNTVTVRTKPTVPAAAPRTTLGSFQLEGAPDSRTVYVYWQQIDPRERHGPRFGYCAEAEGPDGRPLRPDLTEDAYARFSGVGLEETRFRVWACNSEGRSPEAASLTVPPRSQVVPGPRAVTVVVSDDGALKVAWEQPEQPGSNRTDRVESYTVFWCESTRRRPFQCEGQLRWEEISGDRRSHVMDSSMADYQFAVAANRRSGSPSSSGMVWSSCTVLKGRGHVQLVDIKVESPGQTSLTLSWNDCQVYTVNSYVVYYCALHRGQCDQNGETRLELGAGNGSSVRVAGLQPSTQYRLHVAVVTDAGEGQRSPAVRASTADGKPGPPTVTEVYVESNTSLRVRWTPPTRMNGEPSHYLLFLDEPRDGVDAAAFDGFEYPRMEVPANVTSFAVDALLPYTEYRVRMSTCNAAWERVGCSELSAPRTGRTKPGVPSVMEAPRTQLLNVSYVRVRWRQPALPGGPPDAVTYWLRTVSERGGANDTKEVPLPAGNGRAADLRVPECEPGSAQRYLFSIRAVVTPAAGPPLAGPWSEPTTQKCVVISDWPTGTIVGVVVGGAFLMMLVVLVFFVLCSRTKRKLTEMRNLGVNLPAGLDRLEKPPLHAYAGQERRPAAVGGAVYDRLVSQKSAEGDRTNASVSGQPLLQDDLTREECDGEGSDLTPAVNTDSNSCSSSATNYTDSGAECEKAPSPTYKFQWPAPEPAKQLSPYVQAGGPEISGAAAAAAAGPAPPYTKFSPYVDAKAIQALMARSLESLPAGEPVHDLSRSEPDLSAAAAGGAEGAPTPYSQMGHRASAGYVSMTSDDALQAGRPYGRLGSPPKPRKPELKPYVTLGPPPPPAGSAGFPPYVLAGPPTGEPAAAAAGPAGPAPVSSCSPSRAAAAQTWATPRAPEPQTRAARPAAAAGYVAHEKVSSPPLELRDLPVSVSSGYVAQEALAAGEPVLSPKKLPTVATARDPYCRVVTSHQSPPDLGPNVSMV